MALKFKDYPIPSGDYIHEKTKKDAICLHFTAGYSAESARATLGKLDYVSVPFIVDIDGLVNLCYPKKYWSYHLGVKKYPNGAFDRRTVGIEVVNIGPAWKRGASWYDYVGRQWPESMIVKSPFRGADGFVRFTDAQIQAVCELVDDLLTKLKLPREVLGGWGVVQLKRLETFRGVTTHAQYRKDKYDIGPAFPWSRLYEICKAKVVA